MYAKLLDLLRWGLVTVAMVLVLVLILGGCTTSTMIADKANAVLDYECGKSALNRQAKAEALYQSTAPRALVLYCGDRQIIIPQALGEKVSIQFKE